MIDSNEIPDTSGLETQDAERPADRDWLSIASDSFSSSTSYMDANWRRAWEDNLALFQSRHPQDSKYTSENYKHRSRIFRPKTRSVVRKNEAAAAAAFFSNVDVVSVEPENPSDKMQQAASQLMGQLINYRLQKSIPWFQLLIGALQNAQVYGIVSSYQYWKYKEREDGSVVQDKPCIELIAPENIRFDPGADWLDVVGSSPYVIRMVPMYVDEVRRLMRTMDRKTGQPQWNELSDGQIRQAMVEYDSLRQARETPRQDSKADNGAPLKDFEIVWCHENFVRLDDQEYVYWTLGSQHMLTDPTPLEEVYFHGQRPFVIGVAMIEAHRAVPDSYVRIGMNLQREANDIVNQRLDNVKLVLNKRWIAKRGKNVDIQSLMRNVPGGVTMADDPETDVKEINWPDVTSSSYQEQDRLNVDFDELLGNFSTSSVSTNRQLNETVGGMNLLQGGASQLTEYMLRTFTETWVEPVLRQLVKLEQKYETDVTVLGLAGQKSELMQRYGVDRVTDELLNQELTVRVNVGMGATDPQTKLQKFTLALQTFSNAAQSLPNADMDEVRKEIFGLAGYRDGSRFFQEGDQPNPQVMQMQQAMQEMQETLSKLHQENVQLKADREIEAHRLELDAQGANAKADVDAYNAETNRIKALGGIMQPQLETSPDISQ